MTRRPVAFFNLSAADYADLDGAVERIMAAILERSTATERTDETEQPLPE